MKLSEKEIRFTQDGVLPTRSIKADALRNLGVAGKLEFLGKVLFERGVTLASPFISSVAGPSFIGAYSYMNEGGYFRDWTFIGRYCSIGRRVTIGAGMHAMNGISTHPLLSSRKGRPYTSEQLVSLDIRQRTSQKFTVIGNDVWIGDGAVIMPGLRIGTGAVIGANAVVTRDVPPYCVVGGIPAKAIRQRFPADVSERMLASEYWELPLDTLRQASTNNVLDFLDECAHIAPADATFETYCLSSE